MEIICICHFEIQMFFTPDQNLITSWCTDDAQYRPTYMEPLIEALGGKIVFKNYYDNMWNPIARAVLLSHGITKEELDEE